MYSGNMGMDSHDMMDIDSCRPRIALSMSYNSGSQPPSIGDVWQIDVSEPSSGIPMDSDGQPPSVTDVGRREASQSEASFTRYEGPDALEVQQHNLELQLACDGSLFNSSAVQIDFNHIPEDPCEQPHISEIGTQKNRINSDLWRACAGPLVNLPADGTHVFYFPQGHCEQVAAYMKKNMDDQIPNYPNLQSKILCILRNVTLHANTETDEVYAQITLQPVPSFDKEALLRSDLLMKAHKPQTEFFCKTLTASDTSTHGGFSVPRRAAEKIFPPLDFSIQPPAQELVARDLHDNVWTFRHIYRGQPKRHLLTTGWSLFVSGKRLFAGDSVLFIRDEKQQLLLGIRRANRQPANLSSSLLSSDSMHMGILASAAHAAANKSPFTIFYNPRASPSEFMIPLAKYYKSVCSLISLGMRFGMSFEAEESGVRRYMGTIVGISDVDEVRWRNSRWRNLEVEWDDGNAGERGNRVSAWEIGFFINMQHQTYEIHPNHLALQNYERPDFPEQLALSD